MIFNMATTWKQGLLLLGLATAVLATPSSYLKGSKNKNLQEQRTLKEGGLAYQIDFAAADPDLYTTPVPYPKNFPKAAEIDRGNGDDPASHVNIEYAQFNDGSTTTGSSDVKVESLMPGTLYLGQIVPFEIKITVTDLELPEDGNIQFTAGWSTITTSGGAFGYNSTYGVLAAFVDTGDGAHNDPDGKASVSFESTTVNNEIQGVFDVTGLDDGDVVVVEVWVVLQDEFPSGASGNVPARLIDGQTSLSDAISTGTQTVPIKQVKAGAFLEDEVKLSTAEEQEVKLFCQ
jgi:hypothetical protein